MGFIILQTASVFKYSAI